MKPIFTGSWGIIGVGLTIGIAASTLQYLGNPPNMGISVASMERDIAGALGLHRAARAQYLRSETMGFVRGNLSLIPTPYGISWVWKRRGLLLSLPEDTPGASSFSLKWEILMPRSSSSPVAEENVMRLVTKRGLQGIIAEYTIVPL